MLTEELLYHTVPFRFQGFICGENAIGHSGGQGEQLVLVTDIQKDSGDVLLCVRTLYTCQGTA